MLANSLKNPAAKPKEVTAAICKSFNDAPSALNLSIILLTTSASTGFFLLTGRFLVLLEHSIMLLQQALCYGTDFIYHAHSRIFVVTALFRRRTTNSSGGSVYSVSVESRKIIPKLTGQVYLC